MSQYNLGLVFHMAYSCIFHRCKLLPLFPLLHFPSLLSTPAFSTLAFSTLAILPVSYFPLPHFQSPHAYIRQCHTTNNNSVTWFIKVNDMVCSKLHCVLEKSNPCIHCHNFGKQCQILTEVWINNAMSNCKQITKFKQNLCRHPQRQMTVKVYICTNIKHN